MGELVPGTPALHVEARLSVPLDLVSVCSLLYRAVPGSGLEPWLVATRRELEAETVTDLDVLHGFSGRLLYYMEEPVMAFRPLSAERAGATYDDLDAFLASLPPEMFRAMAIHAIERVHRDLGVIIPPPTGPDPDAWRRFVGPALTTATVDEVIPLLIDPSLLRERTIRLYRTIWADHYAAAFTDHLPVLGRAATLAKRSVDQGVSMAFSALTGHRLPATLVADLGRVKRVVFCPSAHIGEFVSYIVYPPDLVVFFSAPNLVDRVGTGELGDPAAGDNDGNAGALASIGNDRDLLEALRALADPTRLRIVDLLGSGEQYAQEIVGQLGIAQSAASRHLAQLERAGLVTVRPSRGVKYYAVDPARFGQVSGQLLRRGAAVDEPGP
ncbi:MAG: winged helix-turn-helix transcriptional regulator [Chloroflexia bacterium]|nr:winged helix-turn-helix transcriptional regulator [Chloroflexia bacterium]